MATTRPRPMTTSEAATPSPPGRTSGRRSRRWRANAISARLQELSISSTESSRISGLRRVKTPNRPIPNRIAETPTKYSTPTSISRPPSSRAAVVHRRNGSRRPSPASAAGARAAPGAPLGERLRARPGRAAPAAAIPARRRRRRRPAAAPTSPRTPAGSGRGQRHRGVRRAEGVAHVRRPGEALGGDREDDLGHQRAAGDMRRARTATTAVSRAARPPRPPR